MLDFQRYAELKLKYLQNKAEMAETVLLRGHWKRLVEKHKAHLTIQGFLPEMEK